MNKENENAECQNLTGSRLKKGAANLSGCLLIAIKQWSTTNHRYDGKTSI